MGSSGVVGSSAENVDWMGDEGELCGIVGAGAGEVGGVSGWRCGRLRPCVKIKFTSCKST